jgi:hypothetical protein
MGISKRTKKTEHGSPSIYSAVLESPFKDMSPEDVKAAFKKEGERQKKSFEELFPILLEQIQQTDPLHLLSFMAFSGCFASVTENGAVRHFSSEIEQAHVEFAQAIALQCSLEQREIPFMHPDESTVIFDNTIAAFKALNMSALSQMASADNETASAIEHLRTTLQLYTRLVRNWGYFSKVLSFTREYYSSIDPLFESKFGVRATLIIDVFEKLLKRSERKMTEHVDRFGRVISGKSLDEMLDIYEIEYIGEVPEGEDRNGVFEIVGHSIENLRNYLFYHSTLRMYEYFTFSSELLAKEFGVSPTKLTNVFDLLSYSFGDLSEKDPEHFFLSNPIWKRPVIKIEAGEYFCPLPQVFFGNIFECLDALGIENEQYARKRADRRSQFLESEVGRILEKTFGSDKCAANFKWENDGKVYETDHLVKIDSHLIIIEDKSHGVTESALRGAPDRIKRHVQELIIMPAEQSLRLKDKIEKLIVENNSMEIDAMNFPFEIRQIKKILRVSVSLDNFGSVFSSVNILRHTGWIPEHINLPVCLTLADFDVVLEILQSNAVRLHYLENRQLLESNKTYFSTEMNLLGCYLENGLNWGDFAYNDMPLILDQLNLKLDEYFMQKDLGDSPALLEPKLSPYWKDIVTTMEERKFPGWSIAATTILHADPDWQAEIEKLIARTKRIFSKHRRNKKIHTSFVFRPSKHSDVAIGFFVVGKETVADRETRCRETAAKCGTDRFVILGFNVDGENYPYSFAYAHA